VPARPAHDRLHVGAVAHLHDRRRADRVEAPVEDQPRAVVSAVAGREHAAADCGAQLAQPPGRKHGARVEGQPERERAGR